MREDIIAEGHDENRQSQIASVEVLAAVTIPDQRGDIDHQSHNTPAPAGHGSLSVDRIPNTTVHLLSIQVGLVNINYAFHLGSMWIKA